MSIPPINPSDSDYVGEVLHDMATLPFDSIEQKSGGTQFKLVVDFGEGRQALLKPMRFPREVVSHYVLRPVTQIQGSISFEPSSVNCGKPYLNTISWNYLSFLPKEVRLCNFLVSKNLTKDLFFNKFQQCSMSDNSENTKH